MIKAIIEFGFHQTTFIPNKKRLDGLLMQIFLFHHADFCFFNAQIKAKSEHLGLYPQPIDILINDLYEDRPTETHA